MRQKNTKKTTPLVGIENSCRTEFIAPAPQRDGLFDSFKRLRMVPLKLQHNAPITERTRFGHIQLVSVCQVFESSSKVAAAH